jgi:hypothetical protein
MSSLKAEDLRNVGTRTDDDALDVQALASISRELRRAMDRIDLESIDYIVWE